MVIEIMRINVYPHYVKARLKCKSVTEAVYRKTALENALKANGHVQCELNGIAQENCEETYIEVRDGKGGSGHSIIAEPRFWERKGEQK